VLQPLFPETRGQGIRESGDTGDTCPRPVSPVEDCVSPVQERFGDTGDTGDTFYPRRPAPPALVDGPARSRSAAPRPKSRAGRRIVGIPAAIVPDLERHLAVYVADDPGTLVFPGIMGGPIRRQNFNKLTGWPHAVEALGMPGLHFHDLRHTGNQFAANSGAGFRDLMARMGHDSTRAAMIYQHEARGADKAITDAIDRHVEGHKGGDDDGAAGVLVPAG
jgi:Phage integrase family